MPIATPKQYNEMIKSARKGGYALPAVNVTNLSTINAVLKAFSDAKTDGIIQFSIGGAKFASGPDIQDAAFGAEVLAKLTRKLAERHNVFVGLHTDHCQPKFAENFLNPLIEKSALRVKDGKAPLFNSHMLDASALPLEENLALSKKYLKKCNDLGMLLELEIGVVGGEEEGAAGSDGSHPDKLYTSDEDMLRVREELGISEGSYLLAATFGNVHGSYKPGVVQLKPKILCEGQLAVQKAYGENSRFDLVFHGGSGSELKDIRETIKYGVVKMNIDTDTQYAFTQPIALYMCRHIDGVLKIDGEVGIKKFYDPRAYLLEAQESMAQRVVEAAENLQSAGKSIFGKI